MINTMLHIKYLLLATCICTLSNGELDFEYTNRFAFHFNGDYFDTVSTILQENGFSFFRKTVGGIFIFKREVNEKMNEFEIKDLIGKCNGLVQAMEQCRDLFPVQPEQPSAAALYDWERYEKYAIRPTETDVSVMQEEVSAPYYDIYEGIDHAWKHGASGKGVTIAITDVGVDVGHNELHANTNHELSYNFVYDNRDPKPEYFHSYQHSFQTTNHGNACSSVAAGVKGNNMCSAGVAYKAKIAALKVGEVLLFQWKYPKMHSDTYARALEFRQQQIDIYSNSWDFNTSFVKIDTLSEDALISGFQKGRKGKGSIFVFPAGQPGSGFSNSEYTIAVNNIGVNGSIPSTSTISSATLVSAFGDGRTRHIEGMTTAVHNESNSVCSHSFGGSSSATALVSGIIALLLEANPELSMRDVQNILVESANHTGLAENFTRNAAGKYYHKVFGFGFPNASKMVELARKWNPLPKLSCITISSTETRDGIMNGNILQISLDIHCNELIQLDFAIINTAVVFPENKHVSLALKSPGGTISYLIDEYFRYNSEKSNHWNDNLKIKSTHFWGEEGRGLWTLKMTVRNPDKESRLTLLSCGINLYGTRTNDPSENDVVKHEEETEIDVNRVVEHGEENEIDENRVVEHKEESELGDVLISKIVTIIFLLILGLVPVLAYCIT